MTEHHICTVNGCRRQSCSGDDEISSLPRQGNMLLEVACRDVSRFIFRYMELEGFSYKISSSLNDKEFSLAVSQW